MRHWISILGVVLSLWLVSPAWAQEVSVPTVNINTAGAAEIAEVHSTLLNLPGYPPHSLLYLHSIFYSIFQIHHPSIV